MSAATTGLDGALVIGGGLAGPAAAIGLARGGAAVTLWERERHPHHKICGEFLSWEAQALLAELGLDLDGLGAAHIRHVRLVTARRSVQAPLGFTARSLTRLRLDAALLDLAQTRGVAVCRGTHARALEPDGTVRGSHGDIRPETLMLATGKHNLRGAARDGAGTLNHQLGFKAYFRLSPAARHALEDHIELIMFNGGYAGLQMVEREAANLCFLVDRARWHANGGDFSALLADLCREVPHLQDRLAHAVPLLDRPLAISGVPYGFVHLPPTNRPETVWRLGDQAAVIPSFTGDGMSLALFGARLASQYCLTGETPMAYTRRLQHDVGGLVARTTWLQRRFQPALSEVLDAMDSQTVDSRDGRSRIHQLVGAAARFPFLLPLAARFTRLSAASLVRTGVRLDG